VSIPTLNDQWDDHLRLFRLPRVLREQCFEVVFDFSACRFLKQNAVAFLGGFGTELRRRHVNVRFDWDSLDSAVAVNLAQNGFMAAFGRGAGPWTGNSIPYLAHPIEDVSEFAEYLASKWLGRGWIGVSSSLCDAIVSKVAEAYVNTFEHAESASGVFCCGQHFPNRNRLNLSLVDFGIGIPANVRRFKQGHHFASQLTAPRCLEWAFQSGTSTKPGVGRGLGLDLLRSFIRVNQGELEVFNNEGYAQITSTGSFFDRVNTVPFQGTLINISLRCDENFYRLASESEKESPF
jgi:hypothetical protein